MEKLHLKDIAKDLNLSKTTVSFVLNKKGDENKISQETQQRIIAYAKKHNYVPNQLARGLSRGKSETIGLIIPNISDIFYAKIAGRIEKKAEEFGYTVVFSSSNEDPKKEGKLIKSMLNRQVEGLIIASTQQNQEDISDLKNESFPFVLIDRHYPEKDTNFVIVDNCGGVKKAVLHLLNLGRKRIGFVTLNPGLEAIRQRLQGYRDALEGFNIEPNIKFIKELHPDSYEHEMKQVIEQLVLFPNDVDAIMFSTHYLAALGLRELGALNIKVPEKVAIVSFDEMTAFDLVDPPITSLIQPVSDIGSTAVEILMDAIEDNNGEVIRKTVLETELLIRKSCGTI